MKIKGYAIVRFGDGECAPAVVKEGNGIVRMGDEVMLKDYKGQPVKQTPVVVAGMEYEEDAEPIAKLFGMCADALPIIVGRLIRDYWDKEEKDA